MAHLMQTHINRIMKIQRSLIMRQRMNEDRTAIILNETNQKRIVKVVDLLAQVAEILNEIK